jgi:hypothetical protein
MNVKKPIVVLNPSIIGKYFDTHEIVREKVLV